MSCSKALRTFADQTSSFQREYCTFPPPSHHCFHAEMYLLSFARKVCTDGARSQLASIVAKPKTASYRINSTGSSSAATKATAASLLAMCRNAWNTASLKPSEGDLAR